MLSISHRMRPVKPLSSNESIIRSMYKQRTTLKTLPRSVAVEIALSTPELLNDSENLAFFLWSIRKYQFIDPRTGFVTMPVNYMCYVLGRNPKKLRLGAFLDRYNRQVTPIRYTRPSVEEERCFQLVDNGVETLTEHILLSDEQDEVDVKTQKPISGRKKRASFNEMREEALQLQARYDEQKKVMDYMNSRSYTLFEKMIAENYGDARSDAKQQYLLAKENGDEREKKKALRALTQLRYIRELPFSFYRPSSVEGSLSPRVYGETLPYIQKRTRSKLFKGCYEVDLKNTQLAIIARVCGVKSLQSFLEAGGDIWASIAEYMGVTLECKKHFKKGGYSLCFGMSARRVESNFQKEAREAGFTTGKKLTEHPLIADTTAAIERKKQEIVARGGMQGAYGWMPFTHKATTRADRKKELDSFFANVIQTFELYLIYSIYEPLIEDRHYNADYEIVCHIHDGVVIKPGRGIDQEKFERAISKSLQKRAGQLGIVARFEWEESCPDVEPAESPDPELETEDLLFYCAPHELNEAAQQADAWQNEVCENPLISQSEVPGRPGKQSEEHGITQQECKKGTGTMSKHNRKKAVQQVPFGTVNNSIRERVILDDHLWFCKQRVLSGENIVEMIRWFIDGEAKHGPNKPTHVFVVQVSDANYHHFFTSDYQGDEVYRNERVALSPEVSGLLSQPYLQETFQEDRMARIEFLQNGGRHTTFQTKYTEILPRSE